MNVQYSNEIQNFLDRVYFYELSHPNMRNGLDYFPTWNFIRQRLNSIPTISKHKLSTYKLWSRYGWYEIVVGRFKFAYAITKDSYVVEAFMNVRPQNDWLDTLVNESLQRRISQVITETIRTFIRRECI